MNTIHMSHMNDWWVKCISVGGAGWLLLKLKLKRLVTSRNVAFKARKLRDSIMEGQDSFIMRELEVEVED